MRGACSTATNRRSIAAVAATRTNTSVVPTAAALPRCTTAGASSCSGAAPSRASSPTSASPSPGSNSIAGAAPCTAASRE